MLRKHGHHVITVWMVTCALTDPLPAAAGVGGSQSNPAGGTDRLWGGEHGDLWSHNQQRSGIPEETNVVSKHLLASTA